MKRVGCAVVVLLMLVGVAGLWLAAHAQGWLRTQIESQLSGIFGARCSVAGVSLSSWPPRVSVEGVRCGQPLPILALDRVGGELALGASFSELRPVLALHVQRPQMDLSRLTPSSAEDSVEAGSVAAEGSIRLPWLRLHSLDVRDASLTFRYDPKSTATVMIDSIHAAAEIGGQEAKGELSVVGAVFEHKGHLFRVHTLNALAGWHVTRGLYADSAILQGEGITAQLSPAEKPGAARVQVQFSPELIGAFVEDLVHLNGSVSADGVVSGDIANPEVVAGVHWSAAALAGRPIGDLTTRFVRRGTDLFFEDIYVYGPAGEAKGRAALRVDKEVPIWGELDASGVVLREVLRRSGADLDYATVLSGHVSLEGQIDPLDLHIRGTGDAAAANQSGEPALWTAAVDVGPKVVRIQAAAEQAPGNHAHLQLSLDGDHFEGQALLVAGNLWAVHSVIPTVATRLAMTGRGSAEVRFSGTPLHPRVSASLDADDLTVMGSPVPRLNGEITIADGVLRVGRLQMLTRTGALSMEGQVALTEATTNDFTASWNRVDGGAFLPLAGALAGVAIPLNGGVVDGSLAAQGRWSEVVADLRLRGERMRLVREPLSGVDLNVNLRGARWAASLDVERAAQQRLEVQARGVGDREVEVTIESSAIDIGEFVGAGRRDIDGTVVVRGHLAGDAAALSGTVTATVEQFRLRDRKWGVIAAQLDATPGRWVLRAEDDERRVLVGATLIPAGALPYELTSEIRDLDLSGILSRSSEVRLNVGGTLSVRGTLSPFSLDAGSAEISRLELSRDAYVVRTVAPMRFRAAKGVVLIDQLELESGDTRLRVAGKIGLDGRVDLRAQGGGDLVLLELLGPPFEATRGPFVVEASVRNDDAGNWRLAGTAQLDNGIVDLGAPVVLTQTSAHVRLDGARVIVDRLTGRAGGGRFEVRGSLDLIQGADLSWQLQDVGASAANGLEARLSGKGTFAGSWDDLLLRGHIEVVNALYDRDLGFGDLLQWLTRQLFPQVESARAGDVPVRLDLVIYSRGGVYLDNNIAKGEMWLDLHLTGSVAQPSLAGRIGILDAEVFYQGRTFTVLGGSIDFRDPGRINPVLNISAESRVSTPDTDYIVSVIVTGTAERPRVQFSADDPALSQNDVLSLVAFGRTGSQLRRESASVSPTATALALLPTGGVEKQVSTLLGVDRFEVSATQARDTGAIEPRVTVGKDITEQLRASVWTSFGVQSRQAVQLEYRWTRRISLLGSWESQTQQSAGAFGGAVKFRFEYWRVPFSLLSSAVPLPADALLPQGTR